MRDRNVGVMKDHGDHGYDDRDNEGDLFWCVSRNIVLLPLAKLVSERRDYRAVGYPRLFYIFQGDFLAPELAPDREGR
jgi:hypothetical protein